MGIRKRLCVTTRGALWICLTVRASYCTRGIRFAKLCWGKKGQRAGLKELRAKEAVLPLHGGK